MFTEQLISLGEVEVFMKDPPIQVKSHPADVEILGSGFMENSLASNVIDDAVWRLRAGHNVVMVIDRVGLEGSACRVRARPYHKFGSFVGKIFPNLREIGVETGCESKGAEVCLVNMDGVTRVDCRLHVVFR